MMMGTLKQASKPDVKLNEMADVLNALIQNAFLTQFENEKLESVIITNHYQENEAARKSPPYFILEVAQTKISLLEKGTASSTKLIFDLKTKKLLFNEREAGVDFFRYLIVKIRDIIKILHAKEVSVLFKHKEM